ncbi:MAG: hypothetical protein HC804_10825 [Anaerolineae bacterium]|nr:hypothetical protein [Anaerolineae bacterium]
MDAPTQLTTFRAMGIALFATVVVFMIGASAAAYFRQWPLPADPLAQLTVIANDRIGWPAQAILFPVAYLVTAVLFAIIAVNLSDSTSRWLAVGATLLFFAGFLLWLPISIDRLQLGANAAELIRTYDPSAPPTVMGGASWVFWSQTLCILAAMALMGAALAMAGVLPTLGWVITGLAVAGMALGTLVMHDWPPFMSYVILLVMAVGLMRTG